MNREHFIQEIRRMKEHGTVAEQTKLIVPREMLRGEASPVEGLGLQWLKELWNECEKRKLTDLELTAVVDFILSKKAIGDPKYNYFPFHQEMGYHIEEWRVTTGGRRKTEDGGQKTEEGRQGEKAKRTMHRHYGYTGNVRCSDCDTVHHCMKMCPTCYPQLAPA